MPGDVVDGARELLGESDATEHDSWLKVAFTLFDASAPSAFLDHLEAPAAPKMRTFHS